MAQGRILEGHHVQLIHVNGNGRDTYKFRAIHPFKLIAENGSGQKKFDLAIFSKL